MVGCAGLRISVLRPITKPIIARRPFSCSLSALNPGFVFPVLSSIPIDTTVLLAVVDAGIRLTAETPPIFFPTKLVPLTNAIFLFVLLLVVPPTFLLVFRLVAYECFGFFSQTRDEKECRGCNIYLRSAVLGGREPQAKGRSLAKHSLPGDDRQCEATPSISVEETSPISRDFQR
uniref:Uncharacterized protein n=1 Tax=Rhodosorus marinus TaxID=101924 RepID=A0A7S3AB16_9RHOD